MIDAKTFAYWMTVLAESTGRQMSEPTLAEWKRELNATLTTEEFAHAAKVLWKRAQFFPTIEQFLEVVGRARKPGGKLEAGAAFDLILKTAEYNPHVGSVFRRERVVAEVGPAAAQALSAIGGWNRLRNRTAEEEMWLRKEFAGAYSEAVAGDPQAALLGAPTPKQLTEG